MPVQIALNEEDIKDRKQTIDEKINTKANSYKKLDEIQQYILQCKALIEQATIIKDNLASKISTSNQLGKAKLIVDLIDKENSNQVIELIKQKGFDNNYLAYMAIKTNHPRLIELALGRKY